MLRTIIGRLTNLKKNILLLHFSIYSQICGPPVNNGQFESSTASLSHQTRLASLNLSFIRHLCQTAAFFRSQGWPLYTGLTYSIL